MPSFKADRVAFSSSTSGTGAFTVNAALTGFETPATAGIADQSVIRYAAQSVDLSQWETGEGTYTAASTTLSRDVIFKSSNSNAVVNFSTSPTVRLAVLDVDYDENAWFVHAHFSGV